MRARRVHGRHATARRPGQRLCPRPHRRSPPGAPKTARGRCLRGEANDSTAVPWRVNVVAPRTGAARPCGGRAPDRSNAATDRRRPPAGRQRPRPCRRIAGRFAEPTCTGPPDHPFCCLLPRCARAAVRRSSSTTTNHWSTGTTSCSTFATGVTRCRPGRIRPHFPLPSLRTPSASSTAGSAHTPAIVASVAICCDAATGVCLWPICGRLWPSVADTPSPGHRGAVTGRHGRGIPAQDGSASLRPVNHRPPVRDRPSRPCPSPAQGRSGDAPIAAGLTVPAAPRSGRAAALLWPPCRS
jgi:hypothetical protein